MHANPTLLAKPTTTSTPMRSSARLTVRYTTLPLAVIALLPQGVWAQTAQPLYPLANAQALLPGQQSAVFKGQTDTVDYSVNTGAAHLVVEVARNGAPADGQTAVPVTLRVLGADGKRRPCRQISTPMKNPAVTRGKP